MDSNMIYEIRDADYKMVACYTDRDDAILAHGALLKALPKVDRRRGDSRPPNTTGSYFIYAFDDHR